MILITKTFNIRKEQEQRLLNLAARQQLKTGKYVSLSDVARDVIDAGLEALQPTTAAAPTRPPHIIGGETDDA